MPLSAEQHTHPSLVDGSEITLHSHPGGGSGPKAGQATSGGSGTGSVSFNTPTADTNYSISMIAQDPGDVVVCNYSNKQVTGFDFTTFDDGGKAEPNVTVDWIVTPYNNQ